MVDLRKNNPWKKTETSPSGQNRNRVWIKSPRDANELKSIP